VSMDLEQAFIHLCGGINTLTKTVSGTIDRLDTLLARVERLEARVASVQETHGLLVQNPAEVTTALHKLAEVQAELIQAVDRWAGDDEVAQRVSLMTEAVGGLCLAVRELQRAHGLKPGRPEGWAAMTWKERLAWLARRGS
jgi:hypothetical protein